MRFFEKWLINELLDLNIILHENSVQSVIWYPIRQYKKYFCSVRVDYDVSFQKFNFQSKYFTAIDGVGNYINISVSDSEFTELISDYIIRNKNQYGFSSGSENTIAIEHTSLTPVYPINLATYRSTVIGHALTENLKLRKFNVNTYYLVSDMVRHIDLILDSFDLTNYDIFKGLKPDHVCAQLFIKALKKNNKQLNFSFLPNCQLLSDHIEIIENLTYTHTLNDEKEFCEYCLEGHKETLYKSGVTIDNYLFESQLFDSVNLSVFNDSKIMNKRIKNTNPSYSVINCVFYSNVLRDNEKIYSIISRRQKTLIDDVIELFKPNVNINPIYFNDVVFKENNKICVDIISEGIFHSVDSYIEVAKKIVGSDNEKLLYNALKMLVLSVKINSIIEIRKDYKDFKYFYDLLEFYENIKRRKITFTDDSEIDLYIVKELIQAEYKFSFNVELNMKNNMNEEFSEIVNYLVNLILYLKNYNNDISKLNINLYNAILQTINNGLLSIGIRI